MTHWKRFALLALFVCSWWTLAEGDRSVVYACFAVIVGRSASADGSVLVGHNEQDSGLRILNFCRVGRQRFADGEMVRLHRGGRLPQVKQTWAYLWSECPGLEWGDSYINQWGVVVTSNQSHTREDDYQTLVERGEIRQGGIGYMLRRLVAERAQNARQGVLLAGKLIEQFGYADSGRVYIIADPSEAWLLAAVRGRRWVARRVPDEAVVVLPNVPIITELDLADSDNFLASADLIDYADARGWFDPGGGEPFDFRKVYRVDRDNHPDPRRWWVQQLLSGRQIPWPPEQPLGFGVEPNQKVSVQSLFRILRDRGGEKPISDTTTIEGAVFQLRRHMPPQIGCVWWRITGEPSSGVITPWYLGVTQTPKHYFRPGEVRTRLSLDHHFTPPEGTFALDPESAWWKFKTLENLVHEDYAGRIETVRRAWAGFERRVFQEHRAIEQEAIGLWQSDKRAARALLTRFCNELATEACQRADRLAEVIRSGKPDGK